MPTVLPAYQAADVQDLHQANDAFHAVETVDDERCLDPGRQTPSQEAVKLYA